METASERGEREANEFVELARSQGLVWWKEVHDVGCIQLGASGECDHDKEAIMEIWVQGALWGAEQTAMTLETMLAAVNAGEFDEEIAEMQNNKNEVTTDG